jgi:hypothetical protein
MSADTYTLRTLQAAATRGSGPDARRFHAQLATDHLAGDTSFVVSLGGGGFANVPTAALEALAATGQIVYVEGPGPWGVFELTDAGSQARN